MNNTINVCISQCDIYWKDKEKNKEQCKDVLEVACEQHADIVIFPEMTLTGFCMDVLDIAELFCGGTKEFFCSLAKEKNTAIIFGMVEKKKNRSFVNVLYMIGSDGTCLGRYEKIHPFSYAHEDDYYTGGTNIPLIWYKGFCFSFMICYDLRFAGLATVLSKLQPDITVVIANWPTIRIAHFQHLLKARSLDIQSYVIGVNRLGEGNGIFYSGGSQVFSPFGEELLSSNFQPISFVQIDKRLLLDYRKNFPFLEDACFSFYKQNL